MTATAKLKAARQFRREYEAKMKALGLNTKNPVREAQVQVRAVPQGGLLITARRGLYSHQHGPTIVVSDLELAEAADDPRAFGLVAAKVGLLVLSSIMGTNAQAPDVLQTTTDAAVKFAGIDVEALKKELEAELAQQDQAAESMTEQTPDVPPEPPETHSHQVRFVKVPHDEHAHHNPLGLEPTGQVVTATEQS